MAALASCRPRRWVPAFAGTTVGGALRDRRIALLWEPLRFGSRFSGDGCSRQACPLPRDRRHSRLPHKAPGTRMSWASVPGFLAATSSCLRRQAPSDSSVEGRHKPTKRRRATHYTTHHGTVRCRQPSPSPRCLESRACGWKRPAGGGPGRPAVSAEAGMPSRRPPPGRLGPPRRSHQTPAAQRLSFRKERRKSSRRGRRLPASRPRTSAKREAEQASPP
ncbi:hypothetical protein FHS47_000995 [Lutibacter sp. SG786]|nr:hypothetical protein [Luteibacter sp. SG786]